VLGHYTFKLRGSSIHLSRERAQIHQISQLNLTLPGLGLHQVSYNGISLKSAAVALLLHSAVQEQRDVDVVFRLHFLGLSRLVEVSFQGVDGSRLLRVSAFLELLGSLGFPLVNGHRGIL